MKLLLPGERLWNGAIVTPELAAAYNSASARIESFGAENLLNGRHNLIAGVVK